MSHMICQDVIKNCACITTLYCAIVLASHQALLRIRKEKRRESLVPFDHVKGRGLKIAVDFAHAHAHRCRLSIASYTSIHDVLNQRLYSNVASSRRFTVMASLQEGIVGQRSRVFLAPLRDVLL